MYLPGSFGAALVLCIMSTVCWGSWANTYKGAKNYPFALFYWDYIFGVVLCSLVLAFTLGSHGAGEPFLKNLANAAPSNWLAAVVAGVIFNVANVLLVAAIDVAGLSIAFPIGIGIAVVEGVALSYALQPKGDARFLVGGLVLALAAVLFDALAYRSLEDEAKKGAVRLGVILSVVSGVLMGAFAPFVARAMTVEPALTPYSVSVLFALGALACCLVFNVYMMARPIYGSPVGFGEYFRNGPRNHMLGLLGGITWALGGCFNFIAAGFVGVPISYAIGQSAPLIAAGWGVFVWHEFNGAPRRAWLALVGMFVCYVAAISTIALAYRS